MTDTKQAAPRIATPVVASLAASDHVKGILCFGSYANGTADEYSDLDLFVFCHPQIITEPSRRDLLQALSGASDLELNYVCPGWHNTWSPQQDRFRLNDILFDLSYNTADWIETVVTKITRDGQTSIPELPFRPYAMLALLDNSVILHDPHSFLADLISRLYPYPTKLKDALIAQSLATLTGGLDDLRDYARREIGNSAFHFQLSRMNDALSTLLFAINEKYDPATKRVEHDLQRLQLLPPEFLPRYAKILTGPFDTPGRSNVVAEYDRLLGELKRLL